MSSWGAFLSSAGAVPQMPIAKIKRKGTSMPGAFLLFSDVRAYHIA